MAKLLFVGCGKMGSALLRGTAQRAEQIVVVKPTPVADEFKSASNVLWVSSAAEIAPAFQPDAVILAIKPQNMAVILPLYARYASSVFLSIAAGQTLHRLASLLQNDTQPIVRAMPNLPASIGKGISVAVVNAAVTKEQRDLCDGILRAAGDVAWVSDETLIDPVTALSGSGPAYVFALVEVMAEAGAKLGLPADLAQKLARQTVIGSGALLEQTTESAATLRQAVTSPGGTTAAALKLLLNEKALPALMFLAMEAATKRAKELSA
ncbi:MAG: pyrroline-5-carboxylate reductase [Alphaproteobacteria bacterium]|nr:pyrroline-5-carboxylate reductase [Alphaproteobacteria bacterium]